MALGLVRTEGEYLLELVDDDDERHASQVFPGRIGSTRLPEHGGKAAGIGRYLASEIALRAGGDHGQAPTAFLPSHSPSGFGGLGEAFVFIVLAFFGFESSTTVAEEKAAKLGVKLIFPIFFCILPSLFVVTVGPVAMKIVRELIPMMNNI